MKRFAIIISVVALALSCFGCASNSGSQSSDAQSSSSSEVNVSNGTNTTEDKDILGIEGLINEPPIACTQKVDFKNVSLMIPEEWSASEGVAEYLRISSGDNIVGSLNIQESDLNANNTDEELLFFVNSTKEQQLANGFTLEENFTVNRKGNLGYIIIPFKATQQTADGNDQDFWGYSFCGYDNELIIADFSCTQDDKDVLETFRWIFENIQVN